MARALTLLEAVLAASHLAVPDDVPALAATHGRRLGAVEAAVFLVDLDQRHLVQLVEPGEAAEEVTVDGTLAGRCFRTVGVVDALGPDGEVTMWVPWSTAPSGWAP